MAKVTAYVYDITQGMAAQMSVALVGKKIDYIPHTGIAVFGKEYFFGGGPQVGIPGQSVPVPVTQVLELGETQKTCEELEAYIRNVLSLEHNEQNYDLLRHNCNHYADDVAKFLLDGTGLPTSIVNVAEEALSTPQGQALKVMIENMERSMRSGGNSSSLNPFSNVGASPAVVAEAGDEWHGDLKAALADLAKNEQEVRRTALQMLLKMTENVEKSPSEQKFRRIKMSNPAFQKKVEAAGGGVEVMLAAGWLPDTMPEGEDCWLLNDAAVQRQASVRKTLESELAKLPAAPAPVPAPTPAAQPAGYGGGLPAGLPDLPGGLGGPGGNAMMQQAQQMMMNNPGMMQQAQQMMQDPNMMAQVQQMMQNPQAMAQLQQMMGGMGR